MSSPDANTAVKIQPIDPSRKYAGCLLPPRGKWPKLTPTEQTTVGTFLSAYLNDAKEALEASERQMAIAPGHPGLSEQRKYWANVASGIMWMMSRVTEKQRYLALTLPDTVRLEEMP
jgi:hypothetical protein